MAFPERYEPNFKMPFESVLQHNMLQIVFVKLVVFTVALDRDTLYVLRYDMVVTGMCLPTLRNIGFVLLLVSGNQITPRHNPDSNKKDYVSRLAHSCCLTNT